MHLALTRVVWSIAACLATTATYFFGRFVQRAGRGSPLLNPVLLAMLAIGAVLHFTHISFAAYFSSARVIHLLLGPATVALAVPLAMSIRLLRRSLRAVIAAICVGSLVSIVSGVLIVRWLNGSKVIALSMAPKAATTPIAMDVAMLAGGDPSLTATFAILAGILAAVSLDAAGRILRLRSQVALGIAAGTAGSAIGTARAIEISLAAGGFASLALGLNGLATALLVPLFTRWWF